MSHLFATLPPWAMTLALLAHLAAGVGIGFLYFNAVWWSARLFGRGGGVGAGIALTAGRLALLGGILVLASLEGAGPLLAIALGVLIARPLVMRGHRAAAP